QTQAVLARYVATARALRLAADWRMTVGTEVVAEGVELCKRIAQAFPHSVFFLGRLVFEEETWVHRILHNETAYQMQRRLQFAGLNAMVLPVRVLRAAARTRPRSALSCRPRMSVPTPVCSRPDDAV